MSTSSSGMSLREAAEKQGIEYLFAAMATLQGPTKGSFVPTAAADTLEKEGAGFLGFLYYMLPICEGKQFGRPDVTTLIKLPWKPSVAWIQCNVYHNGKPFGQCPRTKLIEMQEKAKSMGFYLKAGCEVEFQLLDKTEHKIAETSADMTSYQSPHISMARVDFLKDITDVISGLGWKPYQAEHEGTDGQYEINYEFADALTAADRHTFFKFLVKEISRKHDCRATFMPLLFQNGVVGNGLHLNLSIWDPVKEVNLMPGESTGDSDSGLSTKAEHFVAGILEHAEALTAVLCPTVNSYKRLHGTLWVQMAGSMTISWGRNTRYTLIRLPNNERIEVRCGDASANAYFSLTAILAAGMDGIEKEMPLSKSLQMEEDQFLDKPDVSHLKTLPKTLMEACDHFSKDEAMRKYLGDEIIEAFVACKKLHWEEYLKELSKFEIAMADEY